MRCWGFRPGRPVPRPGTGGGAAPGGALGRGRRGGRAGRGLARRAPLRAVRRLPVGGHPRRAAAGPYPPDRRRHGGERAADRASRSRWASRPRCCISLSGGRFTLGRRPRRPLGGPGGLRRGPARRTSRASPNHSICCCAGCASPGWGRTASGSPSARCRWCRAPTSALGGPAAAPRRWSSPAPRPPACGWPPSAGCRCCSGMHCGDEEKAEMVAPVADARAGGGPFAGGRRRRRRAHVSAGVVQIADDRAGRRPRP